MPLTPDQMDDLVNTTLPLFKRLSWTDISLEHPEYISSEILRKEYVTERGGVDLRFKVKTRNTGLAVNTGILAEDVTGIEDVTTGGTVPWTKQSVNWSYSVDEEDFQSDRETIIELLKLRDHDAMSDMAELNEENMWSAPTSTSDKRPMGIPFWLQKDTNTAANDGTLNGRDPSGFTGGAAGISSVTYARWRNWTFRYAAVSSDDLVRKVKLAMFFTKFKAPVKYPELKYGAGPQRRIYTTFRVSEPLERLAETRNENHGSDLARFMYQGGEQAGVTIGGVPLIPVHHLQANDTNDPLYGVDWSVMRPFVQKGKNMRRMGPMQTPRQHDGRTIFYDTFMNYCCYDRRRCWVGSLATT
jgi:hypothetical protein